MDRCIRVVVVDDSAYSRRTIGKMLEAMPNVEVVGYAADGEEGLRRVLDLKPDLVTLDLVMPKMDGFTLLRLVMSRCPTPVIVISSRNEDTRVFQALELGAVDFVAKPTRAISEELLLIEGDLQEKVRTVMSLNMTRVLPQAAHNVLVAETGNGLRRTEHATDKDIVAIGASTGGPQALHKIFSRLPAVVPFSVVVSQHMPIGFTRAFAERLNRVSGMVIKEAEDGDILRPGHALIAPGGRNLVVQRVRRQIVARIVAPRREDRYQPSVDAMFESVADVYGPRALGVVLTGMGNDGSKGVVALKSAGGHIITEAEESAVVYGMPREAVATGVVDRVAPLEYITREILSLCSVDSDGATRS